DADEVHSRDRNSRLQPLVAEDPRGLDQGLPRPAAEVQPRRLILPSEPFLEEVQRLKAQLSIVAVEAEEVSLPVHPAVGDDGGAFEAFVGEEVHDTIHGSSSSQGPWMSNHNSRFSSPSRLI